MHIAGNNDGTFNPLLAETDIMSSRGRPKVSSICSAILSGSAFGRSILLITGIMGRFFSFARKKLATYPSMISPMGQYSLSLNSLRSVDY